MLKYSQQVRPALGLLPRLPVPFPRLPSASWSQSLRCQIQIIRESQLFDQKDTYAQLAKANRLESDLTFFCDSVIEKVVGNQQAWALGNLRTDTDSLKNQLAQSELLRKVSLFSNGGRDEGLLQPVDLLLRAFFRTCARKHEEVLLP